MEGGAHCIRMPAEEHSGSHGHGKPLVRVAGDRIRRLDSSEMMLEVWRKDGRSAPRRIHVKPQVLLPAKTRYLRQGVDHAGGRCPGSRGHHERRETVSPV